MKDGVESTDIAVTHMEPITMSRTPEEIALSLAATVRATLLMNDAIQNTLQPSCLNEYASSVPHSGFEAKRPLHSYAHAIALTVRAMRRAKGKKNPSDFPLGSPQWHTAAEEFATDVDRALNEAAE